MKAQQDSLEEIRDGIEDERREREKLNQIEARKV
jgi:hypothetical protein